MSFSPEVAAAIAERKPIVALESTIITHGMPFPRNLETAKGVEQIVRKAGAVPATIAVLAGKLCIGLTISQLETLAHSKNVQKLSRADLAVCLATGGTGSTTVAATMIAASAAKIACFATGGIGGVHRGAESSFDTSADLQELAQTPVTVVCAGAKAILDLPKTFEVLETLGVPVIVYRQDTIPAFWSATSTLPAPLRLDCASDIAKSHILRTSLSIPGGQLVANPIPKSDEIPPEAITPIVEQALAEADRLGISGKNVTPHLLKRVYELTGGRSLDANVSLIRNNAQLAAEIAIEIANQG